MKKNLHPTRSPSRRTRSGFTLLEVMMVVIILGILIGMGISGLKIKDRVTDAKTVQTKALLAELRTAIVMYEARKSAYPGALQDLVTANIVHKVKKDGWNRPLEYNADTGEVWSKGVPPDGDKISSLDF